MTRRARRFGAGVHPDLPESLVHFTGRPRGQRESLPKFAASSAEARLIGILQEGLLRGARTFGTTGPVICVSEPSGAAIQVMLSTGANHRGPYEPWAVLVDRAQVISAGFRPVLHMSSDELRATSTLPASLRDRCVRYDPGRVDWLAEREWRLCSGGEITPSTDLVFVLSGALKGVIVGKKGWRARRAQTPPPRLP